MTQHQSAHFRALHQGARPLVLPNAWDAASAALFQQAGATAVATSSAALAWSLGYPDGGALPRLELLGAIARMQRVLTIPLSVDLEDGYSDSPAHVAELIIEVARMGVAGINLEDGAQAPERLAGKIRAARQALGDPPLFINARTDVYLQGLASGSAAVDMTLERADLYRAAGADGLFVPGLSDVEASRLIAGQAGLPLNLMLLPGLPSLQAYAAAGVRRFSAGPANFQSAYGCARKAAVALLTEQDSTGLFLDAVPYASMNALFA